MKKIKLFVIGTAFALFLLGSISYAESGNIGVATLIESLPQNQRIEVVQSILQMVKEIDGMDVLENIYQSVIMPTIEENTEEHPSTEVDFDTLLAEQPLTVIENELVEGSSEWKMMDPDRLCAILKNNSQEDIKNAVIAFVAWDKNNLPVKIEGQFDFMGGSYLKKVNYDEINLVPGDVFGRNYGFALAEDCFVSTFKSIVVSYETFEGKTWNNPYFKEFCELYEGKKLIP